MDWERSARARGLRLALDDIGTFSRVAWPRFALRPYQVEAAREIARSVRRGEGMQFALVFARQAGKDETLAQLEAYLLGLYKLKGGSILVAGPTLRPQGLIARRRLLDRLDTALLMHAGSGGRQQRGGLMGTDGYEVRVGRAVCRFLSASPLAQARGDTASLLLACNEAQDVSPARWDAVFDPMGAAGHATQLFSGTVWTSRTLLARQMSYLRELERKDGRRRVFKVGWEQVAAHVPAYGEQVKARIAQLGRRHPFIRSEYFLEELDAEGALFGPARRAQMRGSHQRQREKTPGRVYAMLLDVAGADEWQNAGAEGEPADEYDSAGSEWGIRTHRDATALTVVEIDTDSVDEQRAMQPRYRVVDRRLWVGTPHPRLHAALLDLARDVWAARWLVVDATGVRAGLAGFLAQAMPGRVVPFVFSAQSKSRLGWDFLGLVESGRYKEYADDGEADTRLFWAQVEACESQVGSGPGKPLRWGVSSRQTHDDLLVSAALCAALDGLDWRPRVARGR